MDFELIRIFSYFLILYGAAAFDFYKKEIPDILTCLLWLDAILILRIEAFVALAVSFPIFWLVNIIVLNWKKVHYWGWGDILIFPPFIAQLLAWGQPFLAILAVISPQIVGAIRKNKEEPVAPYLLFFSLLALILIN